MAKGLIYLVAAISSQHLNLQSIFGVAELIVSHLYLLDFIRLIGLKAATTRVFLLLSLLS
jgi:hypothetical protein